MDQHQRVRDELYDLIEAACESRLSPEQLARLESLLQQHAWARSSYLQAMEVQGLLERFDFARNDTSQEALSRHGFSPETLKRELLRRPRSVSATTAAMVVGIAIAILAMITAPIYWRTRPAPSEQVAAQPIEAWLSATYETQWDAEQPPGKAMSVGESWRLTAGMAELTFRSGAKVVLTSPVEFEVLGDNSLAVTQGAIFARVPPSAVGFRVQTQGAVVTDLGTEFGVRVDEHGDSYAEVFAGRVRFDALQLLDADGNSGVILQAGESAHTDASGLAIERNRPEAEVVAPFAKRMPERVQILSDAADGHYARVPGLTELQLGTSSPGRATVNRIGAGGEFGGNKRIMAVYYFPLPQLSGGRQLLNAELRFQLVDMNAPKFHVDLYGLPGRDAASVTSDEFYLGPNDDRFPKLYAGALQPTTKPGPLSVRSQQLSIYLASLYDEAGNPRAKFAVLRFNPVSDPGNGYQGYAISMRENSEPTVTKPHLVLHVAPETSRPTAAKNTPTFTSP